MTSSPDLSKLFSPDLLASSQVPALAEIVHRPSRRMPELGYRLKVPKANWTEAEVCGSIESLVPNSWTLLREFRSADSLSALRIRVCQIEREVNPVEAVENAVFAEGGELVAKRVTPHVIGLLGDCLFRTPPGRREGMYSRRVVMRNGPYLFEISATGSEAVHWTHGNLFLNVIRSFELLDRAETPFAEALKWVEVAAVPPFRFRYPEHWACSETHTSDGYLFEFSDGPCNQIRLQVMTKEAPTSPQQLGKQFVADMSNRGVRIEGAPLRSIPASPPFTSRNAAILAGSRSGEPLTAVILICEAAHYWVTLDLIGRTREKNPQQWAINKRAFEILRDSWSTGQGQSTDKSAVREGLPDAGSIAD